MRHARAAGVAALAAVIAACGGGGDGITVTPTPCTPVDLTFPGSANGTIASNGCTSGGFRAALYRFTANPANAHRFNVTSSFSALGVEVLSDPPGTNSVVVPSLMSAVAHDWLLPAGTYLLRITARTNGATGTYAATGSNAALNTTGCTARTLVVGVTLSNHALEATDCPYLPADGTYFDAFAINSAKPCTISLSSATMDAYLEIRNFSQANILTANDDDPVGGTSDSFLSLASCSNNNAPIVIRANTFDNAAPTGNYTLAVTIEGGGSIVAGDDFSTPTAGPFAQSVAPTNLTKADFVKRKR